MAASTGHDAVDLDSGEHDQVRGLNGETVTVKCKLKVPWHVQDGHKTFRTPFLLTEMPAQDVLLGKDWLNESGGYIRFEKNVLVASFRKKCSTCTHP